MHNGEKDKGLTMIDDAGQDNVVKVIHSFNGKYTVEEIFTYLILSQIKKQKII